MQHRAAVLTDDPGRATPPLTGLGTLRRRGEAMVRDPKEQIMTTRVGLRFPDDLPFGAWERAGLQIARIVDSFAWCLGDWLVYGQRRYPDRYRLAVDAVGLDYQTLRNYASVARRVAMPRRRSRLSFQHHAEVAALPEAEQERWLVRAEEANWSRNQLRQHVRGSRQSVPTPATTLIPSVRVPCERVERWRAAATSSSKVFETWVVMALDHAAAQVLEHPAVLD
jgi:hypothetical protein